MCTLLHLISLEMVATAGPSSQSQMLTVGQVDVPFCRSVCRLVLHVNGYVDAAEVNRTLRARASTQTTFLEAVLRDDTPYFADMEALQKWLTDNKIPKSTFVDDVVSFL